MRGQASRLAGGVLFYENVLTSPHMMARLNEIDHVRNAPSDRIATLARRFVSRVSNDRAAGSWIRDASRAIENALRSSVDFGAIRRVLEIAVSCMIDGVCFHKLNVELERISSNGRVWEGDMAALIGEHHPGIGEFIALLWERMRILR